jgi:hypothetical protein
MRKKEENKGYTRRRKMGGQKEENRERQPTCFKSW